MAEDLHLSSGTKEEKYQNLLPQLEALLRSESNVIANLANVAAALKEQFNWLWVGFYLVQREELIVGPFQGPIACTRIPKGMGVCGKSWQEKRTLIVDNVNEFAGHIACSSLSQSEIVLPIIKEGKVLGVLDADSEQLSHFDATDALYLEKIIALIPFQQSSEPV